MKGLFSGSISRGSLTLEGRAMPSLLASNPPLGASNQVRFVRAGVEVEAGNLPRLMAG